MAPPPKKHRPRRCSAAALTACVCATLLCSQAEATSARAKMSAYNRAVSKWTEDGGGYDQYSAALPNPVLTVTVSSSGPPVAFKPKAVTLNGYEAGAAGTYMDLHHQNSRLKYYNQTVVFSGVLPLFDLAASAVPTGVTPGAERDASITLTPVPAPGEDLVAEPIAVRLFSCSEFTARVPCTYLASPPPPVQLQPPSASSQVGAPMAASAPQASPNANANGGKGGRRKLRNKKTGVPKYVATPAFVPGDEATAGYMWIMAPGVAGSGSSAAGTVTAASQAAAAPAGAAIPATGGGGAPAVLAVASDGSVSPPGGPAPAPAPAAGAGWSQWSSYAAASAPSRGLESPTMCSAYFRQIKFLTSLTLVAQLSGTNSSFVLAQAPGCVGAQYATATMPVSKQTYEEDLYVGAPGGVAATTGNAAAFVPMRWCAQWPSHFGPPKQQPSITVRGEGDPYVVAQEETQCTMAFVSGNPGGGVGAAANKAHASRAALAALAVVCGVAVGVAVCRAQPGKAKVNYSPLLRDVAPPPPRGGMSSSLTGYGSVTPAGSMPVPPAVPGGLSGAAARSGDIEISSFARPAAHKAEAATTAL